MQMEVMHWQDDMYIQSSIVGHIVFFNPPGRGYKLSHVDADTIEVP